MGIPWDGTGTNCYGMGIGQINMSHGQLWYFCILREMVAKVFRSHLCPV